MKRRKPLVQPWTYQDSGHKLQKCPWQRDNFSVMHYLLWCHVNFLPGLPCRQITAVSARCLTRLPEAIVSAITTNNSFVFLRIDALPCHLFWQAFNHAYHSHNADPAHILCDPGKRVVMRTITYYMARLSAGQSFPYRPNSLLTPHTRRAPECRCMH